MLEGCKARVSPAPADQAERLQDLLEEPADEVDLQFLHAKAIRFQGALLAGSAPGLIPALAQKVSAESRPKSLALIPCFRQKN